jgi:2-oxoglutarate dehydrogenase E1 component
VQGVVAETLQLAQLPQYGTGGTVHFIVNNQLGFTATERETRSTRYCSDLAKGFGIPAFHVSADRPEVTTRSLLSLSLLKCNTKIQPSEHLKNSIISQQIEI